MKKILSALFAVTLVFGFMANANAAKTLKCQTVISAKADETNSVSNIWGFGFGITFFIL